jgi:hypothetical protein
MSTSKASKTPVRQDEEDEELRANVRAGQRRVSLGERNDDVNESREPGARRQAKKWTAPACSISRKLCPLFGWNPRCFSLTSYR